MKNLGFVLALCLPLIVKGQAGADDGDQALIGLTNAVAIAEEFLKARTLEAEMDTEKGRIVYKVELVHAGRLYKLTIDGQNGKILRAATPWFSGIWNGLFAGNRLKMAETLKPAAPTLAAFETQTGGKVQRLDLDIEDGHAYYDVRVTTATGTAEVELDALTGERVDDQAGN
ncbi:MAG: hypothetical protein EP335_07810 [Alphaproteobacteria bacterium]|nr:MAG: hypothetical protein EP335_07810 [Alphaproteobacteria bacterium]